jgi:HSP20 family protein
MSLINWKKEEDLFPSFSSLIDDFWGRDYVKKMEAGTTIPAVNVLEDDNEFDVEVAAPGFKKEEFKIQVENNQLTISSEHKEEKEEKGKKVTRKEFNYNTFTRTFTLPDNINQDAIDAEYADGMLKVILPKKAPDKLPHIKAIAAK